MHLHVRQRDGRMVADQILITAPEITADLLRQVKPARVLASVAKTLAAAASLTASSSVSASATVIPATVEASVTAPTPETVTTLEELTSRVPPRKRKPSRRKPLGRPDGSDPDGFYYLVATAYLSAAEESRKPAVLLAEESGVPVESVRRWIKESRRRGLLGVATRGRAG